MAKKRQRKANSRTRMKSAAPRQKLSTAEQLELRSLIALARRAKEKTDAGKPLTKSEIAAVAELESRQRGDGTSHDSFYRSQAAIANQHGVNQRTVARWTTLKGFPQRQKRGYPREDVNKFVADNTLGTGPKQHTHDGISLTEANILKTLEDAANQKIRKERQLVEQARELGQIVRTEEVRRFYLQTVATVAAIQHALPDAVDAAMPEETPSAKAWPEVRARVLALCRKLGVDSASAMRELE